MRHRTRSSLRSVLAGIAAFALLPAGAAAASPARTVGSAPRGSTPGSPALVTRVVDGDTIHVRFHGRDVDVRLIGVNTPETVAPGQPVQCFGPQASAFTHRVLTGRTVNLEFDVQHLDVYGRTLAYVWLSGKLFNASLVALGYARVETIPPDVRYRDRFVAAERQARAHQRGLWAACAQSGGGGTGGTRCSPAYPTVCIPPPPPDLDCADIAYRNFEVLPPDPQHFDEDHDGIGCET